VHFLLSIYSFSHFRKQHEEKVKKHFEFLMHSEVAQLCCCVSDIFTFTVVEKSPKINSCNSLFFFYREFYVSFSVPLFV
jgi:hypothetical protein